KVKRVTRLESWPRFVVVTFLTFYPFNSVSCPLLIWRKPALVIPSEVEESLGIVLAVAISSSLGIARKRVKIVSMPAVATGPMIRREIGDDHVCLLVFEIGRAHV